MKKTLFVLAILCILFLFAGATADRGGVPSKLIGLKSQANVNPPGLHVDFGSLPLYFTTNRGQVDGRARFYAKANSYTLWLTEAGLVFDSFKSESPEPPVAGKEPSLKPGKGEHRAYKRDVSRLVFLNAAKHPQIVPVDETPLKVNYFIGNDPKKWHTSVPTSKAVLYKNIYKNIDLKVYGIESRIEYDWIVRPGGDPRDIRFQYENVKKTRLDREGNLLVETRFGELMHKKPVAYQQGGGSGNGSRATVESTFKKIGKNAYGFAVGAYDADRELVIDPVVLAYSTYLGGSIDDYGYAIAVDGSGNAYVTGITQSTNFPILNQYQTNQPSVDMFVTKIDTTKSGIASLVYSTYLGGIGSIEKGYAIATDNSGYAYVAGFTDSPDFPLLNQYQSYQGYGDAFLTKIDTTRSGSASLVYSTCLGGNNHAEYIYGIAVDGSGNAYVTGYVAGPNFPILNQYQTFQAGYDAFVTKLDTTKSGNASLIYSTYLGGNSSEFGQGIAVDNSGKVYVTGSVDSTNFPTLNPYQQTCQGYRDVFVTKLDTTESGNASLLYSTYLGGSTYDDGYAIAVDNSGNAYVTGITIGTDFPTLNQFQTDQAGQDAFVTKIDTMQSGTASLVYSTYLGGNSNDQSWGIAVDNSGNAYVTGYTLSTDFPTLNQYQVLTTGTWEIFVTKIDPTQSGNASLVYSTYLGGFGDDLGKGIAVDSSGNAYVTGYTVSTIFPTQSQYQTYQGGYDAFIAKISFNAEIAVTKTSDNPAPQVGETFSFTIRATNNGPCEATGLQVLDPLPAGLAYVSSTASTGTYTLISGVWDIGTLANGATATLTLAVQATAPGSVTNTAAVTALTENDPDPTTNSASASVTIIQTYTLTITSGAGGTTNPAPGLYTYDKSTTVMVLATAEAGYKFDHWSGNASGSANPLTLVIDGNKSIQANFARVVQTPLNLAGEKLVNRNVSSVECVVQLTWQPNPGNTGAISYRIYQVAFGQAIAIADVAAGTYEYLVRGLQATASYRFGVTAVNSQGWESDMAQVMVQ